MHWLQYVDDFLFITFTFTFYVTLFLFLLFWCLIDVVVAVAVVGIVGSCLQLTTLHICLLANTNTHTTTLYYIRCFIICVLCFVSCFLLPNQLCVMNNNLFKYAHLNNSAAYNYNNWNYFGGIGWKTLHTHTQCCEFP